MRIRPPCVTLAALLAVAGCGSGGTGRSPQTGGVTTNGGQQSGGTSGQGGSAGSSVTITTAAR